ncbi:MAG: diaminopimelate decarboxylase, partial [Saprospiraceae bacterium]|nr:diaminopimelate decarboxylase [Saprospiraceae bacterium]
MLVNNGKYVMNEGVDPLFLAEKYGTPLYVYDFDKIAGQFDRLKAAFDVPNLQLDYACKALTNINLLRFVKSLGGALDTVSIEEAQLGLSAGFEPQEIMFTPNGVAWEEMVAAVGMGLRINIDSLPMLERFGRTFPDVPVCIRINPHIMAGGNVKISVGHIDSKFGISYQQLPSIKAIVENTGMCINGLHMHTGSDIADPEAFLQGADLLLQLAMGFPDLDFVDLGGGFKVTYKPGDQGLDLERLGAMLSARFRDFCQAYGKNLTLVFEPGKFLVSEAGYLLATTSLIKK